MQPGNMWYVLVWVAPGDPGRDAWFVRDGPYETREAAAAAARETRSTKDDDRYVRVIANAQAPTGAQWDEAEDIEPALPQ